uniref:G_PROTEIN_RECEP_F1_2 domain-containing protein n=1 Tax=Caenorhabditis tropicalis TaxID=1561998 RepID=A0A1I7T058_9PELO
MLVSLTGLAIWDIVLLIAAMWHHSLWATLHYMGLRDEPWASEIVRVHALMECGHITSTWMLIEVTAERFIAVTRPFQFAPVHRKQRRKSYARVVGGLIRIPLIMTLVACIICLPCTGEYKLEPCMYKGIESEQMLETPLMQNTFYQILYRTAFLSIVKTFGPFIIITFLTVSTLKSMRQSMDSRASILIAQGQNHLFQADKDKTKSLQAISIMLLGKFLFFRCLPTAMATIQMIPFGNTANFLPLYLSHFFLLFNSATNSFVFVVVKSAFETRRLKRIRQRHRELVAQHAEQVLSIGKALAGDKLLLISEVEFENQSSEEDTFEMQPMMPSAITSNPV